MPEPIDDYLMALDAAAELYSTDIAKSEGASVSETISLLRALNAENRTKTPVLARFEQFRVHDLVCAAFHDPKPTETSVAIIIDKGLPPFGEQCRLAYA
jgi:hypothetical protein